MSKCYIFSAYKISNYDYIKINKSNKDIIICADGGFKHTLKLGLKANLVIGDMDSNDNLKAENIIKYNPMKNDTDTLLAVKKAIELGFKDIHIYGGIGGRLDHTYANIQTLAYIADNACKGYLYDENTTVTMIKDRFVLDDCKQKYISVFSYGEKVKGLTIKGLKYEVLDLDIKDIFPIGISNEYLGEKGIITINEGRLLIMLCNE